ncbi:MAG: DUF418 domain-containing protein [Bacteroidota bacterium]|nr:DUF418 domain-containing protein [Bacteroidota bacterium]
MTTNRISSLDLIRGFAALGMIFINILVYIPNFHDILYQESTLGKITLEGSIYKSMYILFDGKMRALFGMLFGVGIVLFFNSNTKEHISKSDHFSRRMFWLLIFGLIHAYLLLWPGSILFEYAACGFLLFTFRGLKANVLLILSILILGFYIVINSSYYYENREDYKSYKIALSLESANKVIPKDIEKKKKSFEEYLENSPPFSKAMVEDIESEKQEKIKLYTSGFMKIYKKNKDKSTENLSLGVYLYILESIGTMLLGMAMFKFGFFEFKLKKRFYYFFIFLGIPIGLTMYYFLHKWRVATKNELIEVFSWKFFSSESVEGIARIVLSLGYSSLLIYCCKLKFIKVILELISNVGRMAFTNYIIQTLICALVFYVFKYYGSFSMVQFLFFAIVVIIIQIIGSYLCIRYFNTGPIEYLWRNLSKWKLEEKN